MINSLTKRLVAIKNEILALKTAHKHGLGSMRLWTYIVNPPSNIQPGFLGNVTITVTISPDSAPYPVIDIASSDFNNSLLMKGEASNNGMTFTYVYDVSSNPSFKIITSSEATVSSVWRAYG